MNFLCAVDGTQVITSDSTEQDKFQYKYVIIAALIKACQSVAAERKYRENGTSDTAWPIYY